MDGAGQILTLALAALTIATAAGFGLQRGRIARLQGDLKLSDEEMARKDRRNADTEALATATAAELEKVSAQLEALRQVVTSENRIIELTVKIDAHQEHAEAHWLAEQGLLEEIRDRLPARSA